ncbi:MAG TPA: tetratricopeptide repeat protein [Anaeromyxobacteraceae bacterium]|nr:tetratricopeptide repeat protein [Anaeromyxobacteraceae bacterium]
MRRLALAFCALAACATGRGPAAPSPPEEIRYADAELVEATPLGVELAGKNDEELFAVGTAAFAGGDFTRAASAFGRLADLFPASRHHPAALYNAGLAHQRLAEWRPALERFRALERSDVGPDAGEAAFRAAECLWHLGELAEARAVLDRLAGRGDLALLDRVRALTWRGVVELDQGDAEAAEASLRLALRAWGGGADRERLDDSLPAQAQYYLGEIYRRHFQAVKLDPSRDGEARLEQALELKAELLLSAQGHYLRAIRMGSPGWAVASGYRIGELYDELHAHLTEAAMPPGLDAEAQAAYRAELAGKVRVLLSKAVAVYERTLDAAQRARVENAFVERTQASLDRVKRALALDGAVAGPEAAGALPPDADPSRP